jgi:murein L,D-transpeptidase YafK
MTIFRVLVLVLCGLALTACGQSKFRTYDGPPVTQVQVHKGERMIYLISGSTVLETYDVGLGFAPEGHKEFEGDGKTPEGLYFIDRRNPRSAFHLSLGISYPNAADRANAAAQGKSPGGDIFIHGGPQTRSDQARASRTRDWTWGCVAVTDREMEEIYSMVRTGTPVWILP